MDTRARAGADLAWLALGRAGLLAASIGSVHTTTRLLGPAEIGTMNLVLTLIGAAALLVAACSHFFYRQAMAWQLEGTLATNGARYAVFVVLAGAAAAVLVLPAPAHWLPVSAGALALLLAGNLIVTTLQQALLHLLNLRRQRLAYVLVGNLVAWGGLLLAALAVQHHGAQAVHWLGGLLAAQALGLVLAAGLLRRGAAEVSTTEATAPPFLPRPVLRFATPLIACMALYWVQRSLPLPWLAGVEDRDALGLYATAFSIGMLAMLAFDSLFKELYAPGYERAIAHASAPVRIAAWERYAAAFFPAALAACICTAAAGPALLQGFTAPAFHGMGRFVAWGALCQLLLSLYSLVVLQAASAMDNRSLLWPNIAGALATAVLLQTRLPGIDAMTQAALASAAGLATTTLLAAWQVRRVHAATWPWRRMAGAGVAASPACALSVLPPLAALVGVTLVALLLQAWLARAWWTQTALKEQTA